MGRSKKHATWAEAKKRCRLNQADIQMAKELGMKPKSLLKNIPSPNQLWKAPVKLWIRDSYEEKFGTVLRPDRSNANKKEKQSQATKNIPDEELPF